LLKIFGSLLQLMAISITHKLFTCFMNGASATTSASCLTISYFLISILLEIRNVL